ncbi:hypothetical protein EVAR_46441_1 [Eumeta japonica]|uniref:Uncharacterized protein n=1 Tax=Eumeta variegata TaxID=151549 RepID=A0A4C1XER7_EUMVA|nr:hypothetical protein EVAR_46441_1 [Eumeta japonica]
MAGASAQTPRSPAGIPFVNYALAFPPVDVIRYVLKLRRRQQPLKLILPKALGPFGRTKAKPATSSNQRLPSWTELEGPGWYYEFRGSSGAFNKGRDSPPAPMAPLTLWSYGPNRGSTVGQRCSRPAVSSCFLQIVGLRVGVVGAVQVGARPANATPTI